MNNNVMLVGHVGAPPETQIFEKTGAKLSSFSLAVKMLAGSEKERTVWFKIKAWGPVADRVEKYVTRGRELVINGQLDIETYNSPEKGRQEKPCIRLSTFHLCGKKPESAGKTDEAPQPEEQALAVAETGSRKSVA